MHEKLGDRTINAVYFRLCEPFQVGALVGSLCYVLDRENLSSRCPLPPWPGRFIMLLGKIIFRLYALYHPGRVVLLCSCAREFVITMSLTTLAGSYYYVLVRENLSSRCPLPPWPGRTIMFLCERICRHDVPYHPGWVVLLCSCAREFFVSMPLTTLAGSYYYALVREFFVTMSLITLAGSYNYVLVRENLSSRCPLSPWLGRTTMFLCERICRHDAPYHPGRVVLLCSCAREFFVSMSLTSHTNLS